MESDEVLRAIITGLAGGSGIGFVVKVFQALKEFNQTYILREYHDQIVRSGEEREQRFTNIVVKFAEEAKLSNKVAEKATDVVSGALEARNRER